MNARRAPFAVTLILALLAGCGPLKTRTAVPADQVERATLDGYQAIRFWGDEASEGLNRTFIDSWAQERAALSLEPDARAFPDAYYLAISGGGQNGAFGAGLLCGWSQAAGGQRPQFKVVTGISTGALIAPFAFLGSDYDGALREIYTSVDQKDVAVFTGILSLLRSDAVYDTAPLAKLTEKFFTQQMLDAIAVEHRKGRRLLIGTTNLDAGRPVVWDGGAIACSGRPDRLQLFRKVLLASSAIPGAFPPVYLKVTGADGKPYDEMHVDGGVTREAFLLPSELRLYELRDQYGVERASHLFIIRNAHYAPDYQATRPRAARIAARAIDALITAQAAGDLWSLYAEARESNMKYAVTSIPDSFADDSLTLFDKKYMVKLFDVGYRLAVDGKAWRAKPPFERAATTVPAR